MKHVYSSIALSLALSTLLLTGCGGGGGSSSGTASGSSSGILTDAPVAGVAYTTSPSGVAGTTDADGGYDFNPGDTVTFTLGDLVLGTVDATGIVSPLELADGDADKLQNLLVLLQSLDDDGDPETGISIPAAAAAAVPATIDLTADPATFASSANTGLQAAMTAGGITSPIVSTTDANAHFLAQGMTLLGSNIWVIPPTAADPNDWALLRLAATGEYLEGDGPGDLDTAGVEHGTASLPSFDVHGYTVAATNITVDTNSDAGLSHPLSCDRFRPVGDQLIFSEDRANVAGTCAGSVDHDVIIKMENDPTGIVGVWANGSATTIKTQHFAFFSDGKFLMVDPLGDTEGNNCGDPGVEAGSYTYNANTKVLKTSSFTVDTNGCAGLSDSDSVTTDGMSFTISADGSTATVIDNTSSTVNFTAYRVSK